uniref:Heme A synthase n=1 Tax=Lygus hesperus TaxID=30085 RepID=A0A0A9X629_LYGHE
MAAIMGSAHCVVPRCTSSLSLKSTTRSPLFLSQVLLHRSPYTFLVSRLYTTTSERSAYAVQRRTQSISHQASWPTSPLQECTMTQKAFRESNTNNKVSDALMGDTSMGGQTETKQRFVPSLPNQSVARWLYLCAAVVGGVVCFGGITRLTESGLSIVE